MSEPKVISFCVLARVKRETDKGTVYRVQMKSVEGHKLTLESDSSAIFEGYPIGEYIAARLSAVQTTLPTEEGES